MKEFRLDEEDLHAFMQLRVGDGVKVKGASLPEGFVAYEVSPGDVTKVSFEGPIQGLEPAARRLRILNRTLRVPDGATIKNLPRDRIPLEALDVGELVLVKGEYAADTGLVPRSIKSERAYGFAIEQVRGRLEQLDPDALTLRVVGVDVQLTAQTRVRVR